MVLGHIQLYGERGRGGADIETGTTSINEGPRVSTKGKLHWVTPVNASRNSRPSQGVPSPTPLHPHPSQVPPAAQVVGGSKFHTGRCTGNQGKGIWLAVSGRIVDFLRKDDG